MLIKRYFRKVGPPKHLDHEHHELCGNNKNVSPLEWKKKLDWFKLTRGIHQGDAISPYLFVLYIGETMTNYKSGQVETY